MNGLQVFPDSKVHGANMGPIWGRQDPSGPHVGPMNFAIWVVSQFILGVIHVCLMPPGVYFINIRIFFVLAINVLYTISHYTVPSCNDTTLCNIAKPAAI